jgi:CheY-like chemotaxis protein
LRMCIGHAAKSLAAKAAQKSLELLLRIDPAIAESLVGDPGRLRQVLLNLIGNAIKFTDHGEISIEVTFASPPHIADRLELQFSVRDTGIGISSEKLASVFAPFTQADASTTRRYGGTGLGLAISSQLVEMMGGRIWAESQPNVGTTFYFTLKFDVAPAAPEPDQEKSDNRELRVLVIDDNTTNLIILEEQLSRQQFQVTTAGSVDQGLLKWQAAVEQHAPFDIVIVDRMMPDRDGFEFVRCLRQSLETNPQVKAPCILMLTSSNQASDLARVRELGIAIYLQKPVLQAELLDAIGKSRPSAHTVGPASSPKSQAPAEPTDQSGHAEGQTTMVTHSVAASLSILLAEDGEVNRAVMVELLKRRGHTVVCVEDGRAAVDAWRQGDFHAIFMDVQMPIMDGLDATREIRQREGREHIPIIAITAAAMKADHDRCLEAGMDQYISKPIDFAQLTHLLNQLCSTRGSGRLPKAIGYVPTLSYASSHAATQRQPMLVRERQSIIDFSAPFAALNCPQNQQILLVQTLKKETLQRLGEIDTGIRNQDARLVVRASHSLKSAAGLFEAQGVVAQAAEIERGARAGILEDIKPQHEILRTVCNTMLTEIERWLVNHTGEKK